MRFSRLLLSGKAAALPILMSQAYASVTPSATEVLSDTVHVIEMPYGSSVRLESVDNDASYGSDSYAASICSNLGLPNSLSVVVTGVSSGAMVFLAGASDRNDSFHMMVDPRLTLGRQNLTMLGGAQANSVSAAGMPAHSMRGSIVFTMDTSTLTQLAVNGRFYLQAVIIPEGVSDPSGWGYSELDLISVQSSCSTYGGTTTY